MNTWDTVCPMRILAAVFLGFTLIAIGIACSSDFPRDQYYGTDAGSNFMATHIEGVDVEAHYKWPASRYGRIRLDMSGTYYIRYDFQNLDGTYSGFINTAFGSNVVGVIPRWKHYAALTWDIAGWSTTVANTYQTEYTDWQTDFNGNQRQVGSMSLWDFQEQYTGLKHWTFTLGVKNVLDTNPPATNQQNTFQLGFDPSYYDPRARFVYGAIKYEFR